MSEKESAAALANLKNYFEYCPKTGNFYWLRDLGMKIKAGKLAGTFKHGARSYRILTLRGVRYQAHRVAWAFIYGRWPDGQIDHINHVIDDNRISNLRVVTPTQNNRNKSRASNNSSGFNGVWFVSRKGRKDKWRAKIQVDSKPIYLGEFSTRAEAIAARKAANIKYGFHENHGQ